MIQGNYYSQIVDKFLEPFDEIYQFAADMGGAGFIFTGENDADIMHNSASINLNLLEEQKKLNKDKKVNQTKIFYSSSAYVPEHNQLDPNNPDCREESAYPANPDSEYGWEKLFGKDYISLIIATMVYLCVLLVTTISFDQKEHGRGKRKGTQQQSVVKSQMQV